MDIAVRVFIIAAFAYFTAGCVSTDQLPYTVQIEHRQKEMDRHPRLGSVLVFPTSGNIDPKERSTKQSKERFSFSLEKSHIQWIILRKIFRDMTIPELFPLSIHSQISYFNQILKTSDIQKNRCARQNKVSGYRIPVFEKHRFTPSCEKAGTCREGLRTFLLMRSEHWTLKPLINYFSPFRLLDQM